MRRALKLKCDKIGPGQYRVSGNDEPYYDVDVNVDPACYCADQAHRSLMCKHEIISRMRDGDPALIQALGDMLLAAENAKQSSRPRRGTPPERNER
jgi:hypothetical protein